MLGYCGKLAKSLIYQLIRGEVNETTGISTLEWQQVVSRLREDDRIYPQLFGFVQLINVQGLLGETLYLQVANETTRGIIEQRIKQPLLEALNTVGLPETPKNIGIVVNPELTDSFTSSQQVDVEEVAPIAAPAPATEVIHPAEGSTRLNPR